MIFVTSYLPPIWYFEKLLNVEIIIIDQYEHFVKQTIRNRCHVLSPNGIQALIIPLKHGNRSHTTIKDIRISNDLDWQRQHWRSLCAAYQRSAFFEFYMDDLLPFYEKKFEFLLDFNSGLLNLLLEWLKVKHSITFTNSYTGQLNSEEKEFKNKCGTGLPYSVTGEHSYPQVFGYKNGFVAGLSIIDLLFNTGPAAKSYLKPI